MKTMCFTGHRASKLCGWDKVKYQTIHAQLEELIRQYYDMGYTKFITGGAQGFDQLVFFAVEAIKNKHPEWHIENHLYAPFRNHHNRWAKYGLFSQHDYEHMLTAATTVHYTVDPKPVNIDDIKRALSQRNHDMINDSDTLCAFITPDELNNKTAYSGTKSAINYAKKQNKETFFVNYKINEKGLEIIL